MIVIIALVAGIVLGAISAKKRGGNRLDMAQYATVYGIIFALLGFVATIVIHRMAL